jgi:hypothetical protein
MPIILRKPYLRRAISLFLALPKGLMALRIWVLLDQIKTAQPLRYAEQGWISCIQESIFDWLRLLLELGSWYLSWPQDWVQNPGTSLAGTASLQP